jgi:hypothetical protein
MGIGDQIAAPGEGAPGMNAWTGQRIGYGGGGLIFGDIAGIQGGHRDLLDTGIGDGGDIVGAQYRSFFYDTAL